MLSFSAQNSSPVQARATKFGPDVLNTLFKIPVVLGVDWAWPVKFNSFSKSCLFASLLRLWNICETCKKRMKQSLFHILNGYAHICSPTETCHGPWNSRVVSLVWPLLGFPVLDSAIGNGFLHASVGFRQIIHTSHAEILYAKIRQWRKQQFAFIVFLPALFT